MKENQNDMNAIDGVRLSPHFRLGEFLNLNKYPENIPTMQVVANLTYGCHQAVISCWSLRGSWWGRSLSIRVSVVRP